MVGTLNWQVNLKSAQDAHGIWDQTFLREKQLIGCKLHLSVDHSTFKSVVSRSVSTAAG
jgi:hypothetical protein